MTLREQELIEEIESLKSKLSHAENWMQRQVRESSREGRHFFERRKNTGFLEKVISVFDKIKSIHIFHHKPTRMELWMKRVEAFLVGAAIILFWRGIWNLADVYLFPANEVFSALASLVIGMGILILSKNFVNQFIDDAVEEAEEFE